MKDEKAILEEEIRRLEEDLRGSEEDDDHTMMELECFKAMRSNL